MKTPVRLCLLMRAALVAVLGIMLVLPAGTAAVATPTMLASVNAERARVGVPPLARSADLDAVAMRWTRHMAATGVLSHNPRLSTEVTGWRALAENVGYGGSEAQVHQALMNSAGHRTNILNRAYTQVGIGVVSSGGRVWVTQVFRTPTTAAPPPPPPRPTCPASTIAPPMSPRTADTPAVLRTGLFFLRVSPTSTACFIYGTETDIAVMGDWDGNGSRTPGIFRGNMWYLRNQNSAGAAQISFSFGSPGDRPIVGDWDGNGTDTIGIVRANRWYLRDSNSSGAAQYSAAFGRSTDKPVAGDWNNDNKDTPGVVRANTWYLADSLAAPVANHTMIYGGSGDVPVAGDWDGNGTDTPGVYRSGMWHLSNNLSGGTGATSISFGSAGDRPVGWR